MPCSEFLYTWKQITFINVHLHQALRATACQVLRQWSVKWNGSNAQQSGNVFASNSRLCRINLWSNPRGFSRGEGGWSQLELTLYVSFYLTKTEILRVSDSSWPSANNFCSSLHSQNTTILDCFNSYTHCKIYIYLVISTFANRNVLRKFFNHSSCSFRQFLPFETRLSSQLRRAIKFARVLPVGNAEKSCLVSNQSNCTIHLAKQMLPI